MEKERKVVKSDTWWTVWFVPTLLCGSVYHG